jgi:hypothetical protein
VLKPCFVRLCHEEAQINRNFEIFLSPYAQSNKVSTINLTQKTHETTLNNNNVSKITTF